MICVDEQSVECQTPAVGWLVSPTDAPVRPTCERHGQSAIRKLGKGWRILYAEPVAAPASVSDVTPDEPRVFACPSCKDPAAPIDLVQRCMVVTRVDGFTATNDEEPLPKYQPDASSTRVVDFATLRDVHYECRACNTLFDRPAECVKRTNEAGQTVYKAVVSGVRHDARPNPFTIREA